MTQADGLKAAVMVSAAFPAVKFTEATLEMWARMLADIEPAALGMAVQRVLATSKFCPAIAEIREAALSCSQQPGEGSAEEAWGVVLNEIGRVGWCRAPEFADEVTARAVQCTASWRDLCGSDLADMPSHRARFLAAYGAIQRRVRGGQLLPADLRREIEAARAGHIRGTLGPPGGEQLSEQHRNARALLHGFGSPAEILES